MMTVRPVLASGCANRGVAFWVWTGTKVFLGLGQMIGAACSAVLVMRTGFSQEAFDLFLVTASLTTGSLLLFKVLGWNPGKWGSGTDHEYLHAIERDGFK